MKNVLIIGKNSYIGTSIRDFLSGKQYSVREFDIQHEELHEEDLFDIQVVIHVAAIVHRKDISDYAMYKRVNCDMPIQVARMAQECGVKQFIFLSSMAVYGVDKSLEGNWISAETICQPQSLYGRSKYDAEIGLSKLKSETFHVAFVRPANVYGKDCRGNYLSSFTKITRLLPAIPDVFSNIKQGMLYIENLCMIIQRIIEDDIQGVIPAQDFPPVSSKEIMMAISEALGKRKKTSIALGIPFKVIRIDMVKKLYGGVAYSEEYANTFKNKVEFVTFTDAIRKSVSACR